MTDENLADPSSKCLVMELNMQLVEKYESLVIQGTPRRPTREEELAYWNAKNLLDLHACLDATKKGVSLEDMATLLAEVNQSHLKRAEVYWDVLHYVHEDGYHRALEAGALNQQLADLYKKVRLSHEKMEKVEKRLHGGAANHYGLSVQPPTTSED